MTEISTTTSTTRPTDPAIGVLTHGMHAVAHHIATHQLPFIGIDISPSADPGEQITVQITRYTDWLDAWHDTVHVVEEWDRAQGDWSHHHAKARLTDTGVLVTLTYVEPTLVQA